jgi:enamine deaminase RidA (YjgF/YER057c/UK114 family)
MLYISGHLPVLPDGSMLTGRIGPDGQSLEHGYEAARHAGLNIVSTLKKQLGDLDRVKQVVKVGQQRSGV